MRHGIYRGIALSIAGTDPSGGAGIQADLKTFAALKVFGTTSITSVNAQNSMGVTAIHPIPPELILAKILSVGEDFPVDAIKTGMVGNVPALEAVVAGIKKLGIQNVVVDPVMIAQSGDPLIDEDAIAAMRTRLVPLAAVVTPNLPEAERLSGIKIENVDDMKAAAQEIIKLGCRSVLVKGGHLPGNPQMVTDVYLYDGKLTCFEDPRIDTNANHGTGCTLSSAIAAELAAGVSMETAIVRGRKYLREGLKHGVTLGHGAGCLGHAVVMDWIDEDNG